MRGSLYDFNPRNTGLYEAHVWKAYYERHWLRALWLVFRLLRSQFSVWPENAGTACAGRVAHAPSVLPLRDVVASQY